MYMISYKKLFRTLKSMRWTRKELMEKTGLSSTTLAKMSKNIPVTFDTINRICFILKCDINEVIEIKRI